MHPFGTGLWWNDKTEPLEPVLIELGKLRLITPADYKKGESDFSHIRIEDDWQEFIPSLKDPGEIPFTLLYEDEIFETLIRLFNRRPFDKADEFQIILPLLPGQLTPTRFDVKGWLKNKGISEGSFNSNDPYSIPGIIRVTGKPKFVRATLEEIIIIS